MDPTRVTGLSETPKRRDIVAIHHDIAVAGFIRNSEQGFAFAGAHNTVPILYNEQGTVCRATNIGSVSIKEVVVNPLQWCSQMGTVVVVEVDLAFFLDGKQVFAVDFEAFGTSFINV